MTRSYRAAREPHDDFEGIAAFPAGSRSDFVTGAAIPVDGGYSSQR